MPVDSARYKVTVWLSPPGNLLKQTHSPEKNRFFPCVQWQKPTDQIAVQGYGKMLESPVGGLSNFSRWSKPWSKSGSGARCWKQFRKKKRTQEEERERRLRDMPTRYVWKFVGLSRRQREPSLMRVDCFSWLHHRPCYTFCVDDNVQHHCDRWAKHMHSFCDLRGRNK